MQPFWYELEASKIAERPVVPYHDARMLVIDRTSGAIQDSCFRELSHILNPQYQLVLNNTKVIKARLLGKLESGADVEIMLIKNIGENTWQVLGKPMRKLTPDVTVFFDSGLECTVSSKDSSEYAQVEFKAQNSSVTEALELVGCMPIPPYIRKGRGDAQDAVDYQTCFAEKPGSIAAPTASLHLTPQVLSELQAKNIGISHLTLHLGTASFKAVLDSADSEVRPPGRERLEYEPIFIQQIKDLKQQGKKILAVGTSATRALESISKLKLENNADTDLFITPGFDFDFTDALITNFHQPGTTHLLLVEAFLGRKLLEDAYAHALKNEYRFLSYGDGMLIL